MEVLTSISSPHLIDMPVAALKLACCYFLCVATVALAQGATITNVNTLDRDSVSGAGGSYLPSFSEEGGTIAFLSHANNLVTNDDSGLSLDVFLADVFGSSVELISVNRSGVGGGNADSMHPLVSRYGTMIVFAGRSSNLTASDTNNAVDLFLRQRMTVAASPTRLITTDRFGSGLVDPTPYSARPLSTAPALGADVFPDVVFQSSGTNLVNAPIADTNNASDIFIYDPDARRMSLVSVARTGESTGNGASHSPQFNWPFIGFISTASDLHVPSITNSNRGGDIYVVDSTSGIIRWASPNTRNLLAGPFPAPPSAYSCFNFALSGGNGAVAYQANPGPGYPVPYPTVLLHCPFGAPAAVRISTDTDPASRPQINVNGTLVAYSSRSNVYVWNSVTQSNMLVSVNTNGLPGNGISHSPVMDRYGNYVVFVSQATDLVSNAPSGRFQIYMRTLLDNTTRLVSVNTNGEASLGDFEHSNIALPRDGVQILAFDSTASDLVAGDLNGQSDIFARDFGRNETRLISRRHHALPSRTAPPMSGAWSSPSISGDGRVVAFTSLDNPSLEEDANISQDLFVRNTGTGSLRMITNHLVSQRSQAAVQPALSHSGTRVASYWTMGGAGGGSSILIWRDLSLDTNIVIANARFVLGTPQFALSSTGRSLLYQSDAGQIISRQMPEGPTNIISVNYSGGPANAGSSNVVLSPNDRWAVFQSAASDIVYFEPLGGGSFNPPRGTLYARDLLSNTSKVASITANNIVPVLGPAVFSADSEWIGYVTTNREIYVRQLANSFRTNVCASCDQPSLSRDASFVAYKTVLMNKPDQLYVKNMRSGVARLITSRIGGGEANGPSTSPQITADGRFVVFQSTATNLVERDNNNASDIFLADRLLGKVLLLSINRTGSDSGNGASSKAILSADGRAVVFQSLANDLIAGDYNDRRDVFVVTLSLPDSDSDGMDDDFEITYFGNLERDGAGDMDNDGHTDRDEFLAGTNPTDDSSILRVVSISAPGGTARQLVWSSTAGRTYVVQFKDSLADNWSTLTGLVRANGSTATATDDSSNSQRFYRVVMEP
jgi:hypothetical protein